MSRAPWLIDTAERLCGPEARHLVFEPLVADWLSEWHATRGARRFSVVIRGSWAFTISLAQCVRPVHAVSAAPTASLLVATLLFGAAGAFLALQPIHYRWLGAGLEFNWWAPYPSAPPVVYYVPYAIATTIGFALLPVMLLATIAGHSSRRRAATILTVLAAMVVLEGFIAPMAMYMRDRDVTARMPEQHRAMWLRNYENLADVVRQSQSGDPEVARAAWLNVRDKLETLAAAGAFALLGITIGRVRRRAHAVPGLSAITAWWLGAWLLYNALYYWSTFMVILLSLSRDWQPWIASLIFSAIAVLVLIGAQERRDSSPAFR